MAFTRKMLGAMGIDPEKVDQIIEAHAEVIDGLKKQAEELRQQADKVPTLEQRIQELENNTANEDWKQLYDDVKAQFESYKEQVATERAQAEKASLYRNLLREAGISEKRIDAIMKVTDLGGVAVRDGAIEGAEELKQGIAEEWAEFIPQVTTQPVQVATPPTQTATSGGANPDIVQRLQARHERMYGAEPTQTKE